MICKKTYNSIDLFKFIAAFLVVGIHTEPFSQIKILDMAFGSITRIAVPFFFAASAFFFYLKPVDFKRMLLYTKHIFLLYVIWYLIYLLAAVPQFIKNGNFGNEVLSSLQGFLFGYKHLWFLQALIIAMPLCFGLIRIFKNDGIVFAIAVSLLVFGLINSTYGNLFINYNFFGNIRNSNIFKLIGTRNGLFYAPVYIMIGKFFARKQFKVNLICSLFGVLGSFTSLVIEGFICVFVIKTTQTILWISVVPLTFFVFQFLLHISLRDRNVFLSMRKTSVIIYTLHPLIISLFAFIDKPFLRFVIVLIITTFFAFLLYKISMIPKYKLMKKLY